VESGGGFRPVGSFWVRGGAVAHGGAQDTKRAILSGVGANKKKRGKRVTAGRTAEQEISRGDRWEGGGGGEKRGGVEKKF